MSKVKYLLCFLIISNVLLAQTPNSWTRVANFGDSIRAGSIAFSIDGFGYVGLGVYVTPAPFFYYPTDLWQYNPSTNAWTQKASFPGHGRTDAISFIIGSKVYVGLGNYDGESVSLSDFWEYDPAIDTWTQKADFGGGTRTNAIGFSIDSIGYTGIGITDTGAVADKDFWKYNPATDTWTRLGDFPGGIRENAIGFSAGGYGYVGFGDNYMSNSQYYYDDLWQYNPSADTWIQKANFTGKAREGSFVFTIGDYAYVGTGGDSAGELLKDFWEYNTSKDSWTQKDSFGGWMRAGAVGFSIGNYGYAGTGDTNYNTLCRDFWMYTPDSLETGIKNIDANTTAVSPNPTTDKLYINTSFTDFLVSVYDITGRVLDLPISKNEIDVSTLPAGVYCVRIQDSGGSVVRKFVKE